MAKYLVTGGSGDIGTAVVRRLVEAGHEVIVHYNKNKPEHTLCWQSDLTIQLQTRPEFFDTLDGVIYAAGTAYYELFQLSASDKVDQQYMIHVKNLIQLTQWALPGMINRGTGRIIVISSIWGETGAAMETIYSTMKAAQLGFVKSLAKELALSRITVNAVTPGLVAGKMTDAVSTEDIELTLEEIPQGELIMPDEIAALVKYLISEEAKHITGQIMRINAGWLI